MRSAYSIQNSNYRRTWLLIFVFTAAVSAVFYIIGWSTGNSWLPWLGLGISLFQAGVGYFVGDKIALRSVRAKRITEQDNPQLYNSIYNLSKIAGIPMPKVYISPDQSANAFACGRGPKSASVCFNQGILDILDKNELEGVAAHELAHIKNRDILIMTIAMVLASVLAFVADWGMRLMFWGGGNNRDNNSGPFGIVIYIIVIMSAPLVGMLMKMAISRSREYLADATGAVYTRFPEGLANALLKISGDPRPTQNRNSAMSHFYISEPKTRFGAKIGGLFSTHPPVKERVNQLRKMA